MVRAVPLPDLRPALVRTESLAAWTGDGIAVPQGIACRARFINELRQTGDTTKLRLAYSARVMSDEMHHPPTEPEFGQVPRTV